MKKLLLGGAAAAVIFTAGAAVAQTAAAPAAPTAPQSRMMRMHDKALTRTELVGHVREMFTQLDTNRDGYLTKEELHNGHEKMMGEMHARMEQRRGARFDELDTNHDGSISRQEYLASTPQMGEHRWTSRATPREHAGMKGMHHAGMEGMFGRMFDMADTNKDGRVSLAEAQAAAVAHFDRADLNHDGTLTPDERRQAHQLMRGQRKPA